MLCNKAGTAANVSRFKQEISKLLNEPVIATGDMEEIFSILKEKAKFVKWNNKDRKEYYAVAARSFSIKTGHARCIDLNELENVLARV